MRISRARLEGGLRSIAGSAALLLLLSILSMSAARAADIGIEIPIDTVIRDEPGTTHTMATEEVGPGLVGQECNVTSRAVNQHSVHPGNDLTVASGETETVLRNVEADPHGTVVGEGTLTLGNEIVVTLHLGEDGVFSGGLAVAVGCPDAQPGRIIIVKEVTEGSSAQQGFDFSTSYGDGFTLSGGERNDSGELAPGTYSVAEADLDGWTLDSAVCDDESDPDAIDVSVGETVTCTFTNDQLPAETGRIIVVKEVTEGSITSEEFEFSTSYGDGFTLSDGERNDSGELAPGGHSVAEAEIDGWNLESAVCDDDSDPGAIDLAAGETVTCTFTNDGPSDEVAGAIVVSVVGECEVVDGEPVGEIAVSIAVDGGAEVVIRDSNGDVIETFTEEGFVSVPEGQYTWEATPSDGFVFPEGFENTGSLNIVCDQVLASILVTVGERCEVLGDEGVGRITVTMSVAGGADVVVRDSSGDIVGSLSADGTFTVPEGDVYTWEATPNEGFQFPPGQPGTGTVIIDTCSNPQVLPFTGSPHMGGLAASGLFLLMVGGLGLLVTRRA